MFPSFTSMLTELMPVLGPVAVDVAVPLQPAGTEVKFSVSVIVQFPAVKLTFKLLFTPEEAWQVRVVPTMVNVDAPA